KYTPELHFVRDAVEESAARVDELLSEIEKDRRDRPPAAGGAGEEEKGREP
ncbi:MAG: ribosome-binding factor A, partial [Acidobacteria bacterium]